MSEINSAGRVLVVVEEIPERPGVLGPREGFEVGTVLYQYMGATYGCIGDGEIAVSVQLGVGPFHGVPYVSVHDLVHMWCSDEDGDPTDQALCDRADGAFPGGLMAHSTWQVNCPACERIRDYGTEAAVAPHDPADCAPCDDHADATVQADRDETALGGAL